MTENCPAGRAFAGRRSAACAPSPRHCRTSVSRLRPPSCGRAPALGPPAPDRKLEGFLFDVEDAVLRLTAWQLVEDVSLALTAGSTAQAILIAEEFRCELGIGPVPITPQYPVGNCSGGGQEGVMRRPPKSDYTLRPRRLRSAHICKSRYPGRQCESEAFHFRQAYSQQCQIAETWSRLPPFEAAFIVRTVR